MYTYCVKILHYIGDAIRHYFTLILSFFFTRPRLLNWGINDIYEIIQESLIFDLGEWRIERKGLLSPIAHVNTEVG